MKTESVAHSDKVRNIRPALGIFAVLLGASIATFFGRILSVGIADIRGDLHLDADSASWIGTTFNMGMMFIDPFSTYVGGIIGARRVLLSCACAFTLTTLAMPFAGRLSVLILLLAFAGLTAGSFYPLTLSFILRNLPKRLLHYGIAAYAVDIVATTHLAHSYEGWVMAKFSWPWLFWTFSLLTPLMALSVLYGIPPQPLPPKQEGQSPSWRAFFYASLGAALLYGALDQGERLDWWRSAIFIAMVVAGSFLLAASAVRHLSRPNPLINFPFLRSRNIVLLGLTVMSFRFVLLSGVVLVPSYLASIQGYRSEQTGEVLLWLALPQLLSGAFAVYLLGSVDARIILAIGFSLIAAGCIMNAQITTQWAGNSFELSQLVLALGEGLAFNGMVGSIVLTILGSGEMMNPSAVLSFGGFFQTVRLFGGELGASFIQFLLHSRQVLHYDHLASNLVPGSPEVGQRTRLLFAAVHARSATSNIATGRVAELFVGAVKQQAFTLSVMDCFIFVAYAATACLLLGAFLAPMKISFSQVIANSTPEAPRS